MEIWNILLLFAVGLIAGVINTLAGGGSLLTLPALIFLGLPPNVANATNRIGVFFNGLLSWKGYQSKGVKTEAYDIWLGVTSFIGAILGSYIAVDIKGDTFNKILAAVIVMIVAYMVFGKRVNSGEGIRTNRKSRIIGLVTFFFIGIYGGFIQAGVGYLIIASLSFIHHFSIIKINMIKSLTVLIYTLSALGVFIYSGIINWELGLALAAGNGAGGWLTSRWSTKVNEKYIRYFVMFTAIAFAIKLFFS
ncbi:sulfite exporter TauE/SafE family protein [Roseivirga sp.]|uniref:sulfite exporter TauE/SafE family protein n=1 Tax=Roseivirga sp. TaxID=1964215 RepID=UPI003B52A97E